MLLLSRRLAAATLVLALGACQCAEVNDRCDWPQWAQDPAHRGVACRAGQPLDRALARIEFDPFSVQEQADNADYENDIAGALLVHYPTPLIAGDDVYLMVKAGAYLPCEPPGSGMTADGGSFCGMAARDTQVWTERRYAWEGGALVEKWTVESDWKPVPVGLSAWEPAFQPALGGDFLYLPAANGDVLKVDRRSGAVVKRIAPLADVAGHSFVAGGLAVDATGNLFYTALTLQDDFRDDPEGWLVKVSPADVATRVRFAELVPDAPAADSLCSGVFSAPDFLRPYPPAPDAGIQAQPPQVRCQTQRPALNAVPAIGDDGTVFVVSRAHRNARYGYLVAATSDLQPRWAASFRGLLNDGCGVLNPAIALPNPDGGASRSSACRVGALTGVDPATNEPPAAQVNDSSSSSPVVLPDGAVLYGAVTGYNAARGHLLKFDGQGRFAGSYDFGWDVTPAVYKHGGTYSIVIKDNHYFEYDGSAPRFFITQLNKDLHPEWQFQNAEMQSCQRTDGGLQCTTDHPDGFEWCINAPAVDPEGTVFTNAEDGFLYAIGQGGTQKGRFFLKLAVGAAYTPIALDRQGRIYALNGGELTVVGK